MEEQFNCRKCKIDIGGHNQYLHDGMCNNCFFSEYLPEDAQVFETDLEQIKQQCYKDRTENRSFLKFLQSTELDTERLEKIIKEITSKISCLSKACCEFIQDLKKDNFDKLINNAAICPVVFNVLENAKLEFEEEIFVFENSELE